MVNHSSKRLSAKISTPLFCGLALITATSIAQAAPLHVMLDPGHGGVDTGATRGHLKEAEIALKVTNELAALLKDDLRFKVSMTRTRDEKVSLNRRTEMAHNAKADLFVSIHLNSSTDPRAHGKEIYFQNQLPADEEALFLASKENTETDDEGHSITGKAEPMSAKSDLKLILEDLKRNHRILASSELSQDFLEAWVDSGHGNRIGSRAIRQAPFHVVSRIDIPSVLVEIGFISHAQEGPKLSQASYQKEMAQSLYKGLIAYSSKLAKETSDNEGAENLKSAE